MSKLEMAGLMAVAFTIARDGFFGMEPAFVELPSPLKVVEESARSGPSYLLEGDAYETVRHFDHVRMIGFPLEKELEVDLELDRFEITPPGSIFVARTKRGDTFLPRPEVTLFKGSVKDRTRSKAVLAISRNECLATIFDGQKEFCIYPDGPIEGGKTIHLLRGDVHPFRREYPFGCGVVQEKPVPRADLRSSKRSKSGAGTFGDIPRVCWVALECDYEYRMQFENTDQAFRRLYQVFGTVSAVYETELNVRLDFPYMAIWTDIDDPYQVSTPGGAVLDEFRKIWVDEHSMPGKQGYVPRDCAHLLSGRGLGDWSWVGVLCGDMAYSTSVGGNGDFTHDIFCAAHELGHTFGSIHTHEFNPPIDRCDIPDCSVLPGTIMSYCHNCGWNNMIFEFHPLNIAQMENYIGCLRRLLDPVFVDWSNQGPEDGSTLYPFRTIREGMAVAAPGGNLYIAGGDYPEDVWDREDTRFFTIWRRMTIRAYDGVVRIGR